MVNSLASLISRFHMCWTISMTLMHDPNMGSNCLALEILRVMSDGSHIMEIVKHM